MIEIKDISGKTRFSTAINKGAKGKFTLMKEDYIILPFSVPNPIQFKLGDYVDLSGILDESLGGKLAKIYEITDIQKPTYNTSTGGYDYELQMNAYYWKWKNKIFKYTPEQKGSEASWSLTASLDVQLGVFLRNLKALGYTYRGTDFTFSIDDTVENKAIAMTYDNMNLLDALFSMAGEDKWNCDCWTTDNVIHFGRNEFGDAVKIERGIEASSITRSESQGTYATRIYAFGSTKNIPANYRPTDEQAVVNGVVQKRLMLPADTPYIDAYEGMSEEEAIEDVVIFDDVYPRRIGTLSDVHTRSEEVENEDGKKETVTYYRYKDAGLEFKEEYIIEGQELKIKFQSGKLNGLEFGVIFNPTPKDESRGEQLWEIVRNEDYGRPLPDDVMYPENGDEYILSGFDIQLVSDLYIPEAEQELKEKALKYADKVKTDDGTYPTTLASDWVHEDPISRTFEFGQRINLVDDTYFENGRIYRVLGWELSLDIPWDSPVYTIGESMPYSRIGEIEDKVDSLTYKGQTYIGNGGSNIYVIRVNDFTAPSDSNVFSALRSIVTFLRKDKSDTTSFLLTLLEGSKFGKFIQGISGGFINGKGEGELLSLLLRDLLTVLHVVVKEDIKSENYKPGVLGTGFGLLMQDDQGHSYLEIDKLFVRVKAMFTELEIKKLSYAGGNFIFSPAGITLYKVEEGENSYKCYFTNDDGSTATENLFRVDDLVLCQEFNIKPGVYENVKNRRYWRAVTAVGDDWFELSKTDCEPDSDIPHEGDAVVVLGNKTDATRQNAIIISVYGEGSPSFTQHKGIKTYSLEGTEKTRISPDGNVFTGSFLFESGTSVEVAVKDAKDAAEQISTALGDYKKEVTSKFEATDRSITAAVTTSKEYTNTSLAPVKQTADAAKKTADTTASDLVKFKETTTAKFQVLEGEISSKVSTTTLTETRKEILSTTATDATTKANNAKSAAISAAATDAQKKADAAKSAAISAAASDAAKKYATITTVTQMQTSITQLNNQISLKADKTTTTQIQSDLDKAESNISSLTTRMQSAEAKITPDAIKLTVRDQTIEYASAFGKGEMLYRDPTFKKGTNGAKAYDNKNSGKLSMTRVSGIAGNPNDSGYCLKIVTNGSGTNPGWGGFYFGTSTKANQILVTRIVAKIPTGRSIAFSTNAAGDGKTDKWLTSNAGTGKWTEYVHKLVCGGSGTFSSTAFFYLSGGSTPSASAPLTWYVAYATVFDVTGVDDTPTTSEITSSLTIDTGGISLLGKKISLKGMVTFSSLDSSTQNTINGKASTSYVDSAKASAISTAAADATTKANNAKSAAISAAAADAQKKVDTLTGKLGDLAYKDMVGKAQLDTTVISGGYIVTSLINANYIKSNIITASYINSLAITTGKITVTEGGKIGGFTVQGDMLINRNANACVFFNDTAKGIVASVGANTMPATLGYPIPGRFESTKANGTGYTNVALYVKAAGAQYNRAIEASGAIITTGLIASTVLDRRVFSSANTYYVIDNIQNASYIAYFNADNCSIVLPRKSNLIKMLGVSSSASFSFRFMILADGPKSGKIYGRTSKLSGCNTTDYPILKDWNGTANYDGYSVGSGDSYDLLLFYDGTTYVAFVLNQSK